MAPCAQQTALAQPNTKLKTRSPASTQEEGRLSINHGLVFVNLRLLAFI